jgi:hypothetical protein
MEMLDHEQTYSRAMVWIGWANEPYAEGVPGEHIKLIALLNKFGFNPMSKHAALTLAEQLLNQGWEDPR